MAKYIVLDSKFNPTSFQDMIAPYQEYFQRMDKLQEKREELELATEQVKWMFDEAYAGENSNPWIEYNNKLEDYAEYASKPIDIQEYINKGVNLRKQYIKDIEKMNTAYKLYAVAKEQRDKEILQDPTRVYNDQKDFNLRRYYDNLNYNVESASGKYLASNVSNKAKTKSGSYRSSSIGSIQGDPSSNLLIQHFGENPNDVLEVENKLIEWSNNPNQSITFSGNNAKAKSDMANIVINEVLPYKDWNTDSFKNLVRTAILGMYDAIGQDRTQIIANKEYINEQEALKKQFAEEQAYRKQLLDALNEEFEGDTHQTTSLIFGNSNPVKDFSGFKNDDGTYGWNNAIFDFENPSTASNYLYNTNGPFPIIEMTLEDRSNLIKAHKDKIKYSEIKRNSNIDNLLKSNLPSDIYNNLTVADAEKYFTILVNNQTDANLMNLPYWELNSGATKEFLESLDENVELPEYTGYDYDNNKFTTTGGESLKVKDSLSNLAQEKYGTGSRILLGNNGEIVLNLNGRYYEIPSNRLSNELRAQYNDIFVVKNQNTGMTKNEELKLLEQLYIEEYNKMIEAGESPSLEFLSDYYNIKKTKKEYSQIINNIGKMLNTYTGTKNNNTKQ